MFIEKHIQEHKKIFTYKKDEMICKKQIIFFCCIGKIEDFDYTRIIN